MQRHNIHTEYQCVMMCKEALYCTHSTLVELSSSSSSTALQLVALLSLELFMCVRKQRGSLQRVELVTELIQPIMAASWQNRNYSIRVFNHFHISTLSYININPKQETSSFGIFCILPCYTSINQSISDSFLLLLTTY